MNNKKHSPEDYLDPNVIIHFPDESGFGIEIDEDLYIKKVKYELF